MRVLALLTDAFGGRGGIAQHNRHLLSALASASGVREVVALPRLLLDPPGPLPDGLTYRTDAAGSKAAYLRALAGLLARDHAFDLIVSGHLNLLPAGVAAKRLCRAPLVQIVHGIEAWPVPGRLRRRLVRSVDRLVSVSAFTLRRTQAWAALPAERTSVVPNAVDLDAFTPGPKRPDLLARYGIEGCTVLLTVARLAGRERYKGIDKVLAGLPAVARAVPDVAYLVVGDGNDRPRLEALARAHGVADRVMFAGYVPEAEKADHYRLADAFVMPGRGEGFGIVYLEALACGVPVVASTADASQEAVLDGELGEVVDPDDSVALVAAIRAALARPHGVPSGLETFTADQYRDRWHACVTETLPTLRAFAVAA